MNEEQKRLNAAHARTENWQRWGPYLSERQWGTVREDYSYNGDCWNDFPFEDAHRRAYRWGEDGILGITDRECRLCFALSMWNGRDPILKERLYGLNSEQGNHGEDVKEEYWYVDSTPTHSYMKGKYRYPQDPFPYEELRWENSLRGRDVPEYELRDTHALNDGRFFDITVEYAKNSPNDLLIQITVENQGDHDARIHLLPTLWFRNTWIWGCKHEGCWLKPTIRQLEDGRLHCRHQSLEPFLFEAGPNGDEPATYLFTENETNTFGMYQQKQYTPYVKDAFHRYIVNGDKYAVSPKPQGSKVAAHYQLTVPAHGKKVLQLRLCAENEFPTHSFGKAFEHIIQKRRHEADEFYQDTLFPDKSDKSGQSDRMGKTDEKVAREAYAGLLWSKQFYHYVIEDWLTGDRDQPVPPPDRRSGRNSDWKHLFNRDVISMPDKWEYPWYASWDLAFHMIPMTRIDPQFAKDQLLLFLREWYMHPNGQIPAYEFAFGDVNPPVHAWSAYEIFAMTGKSDKIFLSRVFQKLLMNFTWWVNRKDPVGNHLFSGGFLGMDNIGVFDRSHALPFGDELHQADGTGWMAFYCTNMLMIALELGKDDPAAADMASKFFEHFVAIADAMNTLGGGGLWDEDDGFYYDQVVCGKQRLPLRVRSMVGLLPILAVDVLQEAEIRKLPAFYKRLTWFLNNRKDLADQISYMQCWGDLCSTSHRLLAIPSHERLMKVLHYMLDEDEFLSPFGIRSLSRKYEADPFVLKVDGHEYAVRYTPGESDTPMFGGNSNWRGPIWFPLNFLIIRALQKYHEFYGDHMQIECPTGSGQMMNFGEVADEISRRLQRLFINEEGDIGASQPPAPDGSRPELWKQHTLFYEYFHPETGKGLGASHQTGWTALIAELLRK